MKTALVKVIFLFMCLAHTTGLCFTSYSPDFLTTKNCKLKTDSYSANYGPHGEDWGSTGYNPTPFAWLGGYGVQTLETDTPLRLYLTRHRVYSATLNRFLSSDPIGLAGGNNLYAYGEGNPMAYIDPLGLCGQDTYQTPEFRAPTAWELETWGMSDWEKDKLFLDFFKGSVFEDEVRQVMVANDSQFAFAQKTAEEMFWLVASMSVGGGVMQYAEKAAATTTERLVIGRGADLAKPRALAPNEFKLSWPKTETYRTEWEINSRLLRTEMQNMRPIRDISYGNNDGIYLNAERLLLKSRGWSFNEGTSLWMPPN